MTTLAISGIPVFPLALGGNTFGWTSDEETSFAILDEFLAVGGNFVDTADGYSAFVPGNSGGESETIIGDWLAARGRRDQVVLATKVSSHPEFPGLSAKNVAAAADASLARLKTDYIDLYYAHHNDAETPVEETAAAFDALVEAGKVRAVAISNLPVQRIVEWLEFARREGLARPVALQPHYNLVKRAAYEREIAPLAAAEELAVVPYFGLASGFLTGKYRNKGDLEGSMRGRLVTGYFSEAALAVVDTLSQIGAGHGVGPGTVALAWLRTRPNVVAPLASARTLDQLPGLLAAATLELAGDELVALDEISARVPE